MRRAVHPLGPVRSGGAGVVPDSGHASGPPLLGHPRRRPGPPTHPVPQEHGHRRRIARPSGAGMKIEERWKPNREPLLMALVSGLVDTLGFVALFGLFTAHVTGNLVLAGAELVVGRDDVFGKLLAIPVFVAAVAVTAVWIRRSKRPEALLPVLMVVEALWLGAAMVAGMVLAPLHGADAPPTLLVGMLMVIAMGIRNAATKLILGFIAPTTVMTGNVVQLTIDFAALPDPAARTRIGRFLPTVLGFV
ncbi:DUF1275 domain-containing protein, partial [bacterium]